MEAKSARILERMKAANGRKLRRLTIRYIYRSAKACRWTYFRKPMQTFLAQGGGQWVRTAENMAQVQP